MTPTSTINVLDHGYARLVDHMGNDLSIVRAARVSHDADWRSGTDTGSDHRLIHYLWANAHTTPFESVEFQFEIKAPIFVVRQWHRHRTWSYNEVSARYTELPEEFYIPEQIQTQSTTNRQGRSTTTHPHSRSIADQMRETNEKAFWLYHNLCLNGVSRELARTVLPLATYTRMFAKVNLKNLLHFLTLRLDPHAQYEIRVYAEALAELIQPIVPIAMEAWMKSQPQSL
jgi:thymidylate synthase (FAD)